MNHRIAIIREGQTERVYMDNRPVFTPDPSFVGTKASYLVNGSKLRKMIDAFLKRIGATVQ